MIALLHGQVFWLSHPSTYRPSRPFLVSGVSVFVSDYSGGVRPGFSPGSLFGLCRHLCSFIILRVVHDLSFLLMRGAYFTRSVLKLQGK
jgi:hypothetical protein